MNKSEPLHVKKELQEKINEILDTVTFGGRHQVTEIKEESFAVRVYVDHFSSDYVKVRNYLRGLLYVEAQPGFVTIVYNANYVVTNANVYIYITNKDSKFVK